MPDPRFRNALSWEEKARTNPLWAVMSVPEFEQTTGDPAAWSDEALALFFAKGRALWEIFLRPAVQRTGLRQEEAFIVEYGCGMGRILNSLCADGFKCAGIDLSPTMLEHGRRLVPGVSMWSGLDLHGRSSLPDGCADMVFSYAVLQHVQRLSDLRTAVREICRLAKPGGLVRIQFQPTAFPFRSTFSERDWTFNWESRSLHLKWLPLGRLLRGPESRSGPPVPVAFLRSHGHWTGVPIRFRAMESLLRKQSVHVLGLDRDPAADWNSVWILGRKSREHAG